ncbi:hypothetical protein Aperf_G00000077561 [Anoplocephala perfoliata]
MGISLSKNSLSISTKLKLKGNKEGKTCKYRQALEDGDTQKGDTCHANVCNAGSLRHNFLSECNPNSNRDLNGSQCNLERTNLQLPSLTLLAGSIHRPDSSLRRINTTPNIAETVDKFVQAGVAYASLRDVETNTFQPIFPYTYDAAPQIVNSQAKGEGEVCTRRSMAKEKILLSREEGGKVKVLSCVAKVRAGGMDSKRRVGRRSKGRFIWHTYDSEYDSPSAIYGIGIPNKAVKHAGTEKH